MRYANEAVYYRLRGDEKFQKAVVTREHADEESVTIKAVIPPVDARDGDVLEYYKVCEFDGNPTLSEFNENRPYSLVLSRRK
jgi:hypothetical protein